MVKLYFCVGLCVCERARTLVVSAEDGFVRVHAFVFAEKRESGLCPLGLSVSLIKDRRLTERKCVARLACRPRQQHATLAVWREEQTWGGGGGVSRG